MMQNSNSEKLKKILMAIIILALFGGSYYYYAGKENKEKQAKQDKKPVIIAENIEKKEQKADIEEQKVEEKEVKEVKEVKIDIKVMKPEPKQVKIEPKQIKNTIKPTDKKKLIANAAGISGKHDPFSYAESKFIPFRGDIGATNGDRRTSDLPVPPTASDYSPGGSSEPVIIKGFMGNKVIAEIKGYTESLGINESLKGIKVLRIDSANLTCDFEIEGKKVTKTMKPLTRQNKNIEINHIHN